jgi:hypothetical protein
LGGAWKGREIFIGLRFYGVLGVFFICIGFFLDGREGRLPFSGEYLRVEAFFYMFLVKILIVY